MYLLVFDPIDMLNIKTTTTTTTLLFVCFTFYNSKLKLIDNCKLLLLFAFFSLFHWNYYFYIQYYIKSIRIIISN